MMRYRQLAVTLAFFAMAGLLYGCGGGGSMPAWNYGQKAEEAAKQAPAKITAPSAHTQTPPAQLPSYETHGSQNQYASYQPPSAQPTHTQAPRYNAPAARSAKVAILLPLSGPQANLGQSMLNTAQMALFDVGHSAFELMPYDTQGTGDGARNAATLAIQDGAQLILGPVFANSVRAAKQVVRYHNLNMIAFSTDWSVTSSNVFIMGFLPFDQIERIITYAANNNLQRIAAIAPQTTYGRAIISAYQTLAQQMGIEIVDILSYDPQDTNLGPDIRAFTHYDQRMEEAATLAETLQNADGNALSEPLSEKDMKQEIERIKAEMEPPFEAVLIAAGGNHAVTISNLLSHFDLPPRKVKRLGIGLFDDAALAGEFALRDAWFSAPSTTARAQFETRYRSLYGAPPVRLASLAYDATALSAILARSGMAYNGQPNFNRNAITNPNGFAGIDGIFRFLENGTVERGLAILSFQKNQIQEVDPAPKTFQR